MNTYAACPISNKKIDERVARLNGLFTFLLITSFIFTHLWYIPAFLALDFLMRSTDFSKYSLMGFVSRSIVKLSSTKKKLVNAGPKTFAARIGLIVSSAIFILSLLSLNISALTLAGILALFSFLETAFGYCVACKVHPHLTRIIQRTNINI